MINFIHALFKTNENTKHFFYGKQEDEGLFCFYSLIRLFIRSYFVVRNGAKEKNGYIYNYAYTFIIVFAHCEHGENITFLGKFLALPRNFQEEKNAFKRGKCMPY